MYNTVSEEFCEYLLLEMEKMYFHAALEGVRVMELPSYYSYITHIRKVGLRGRAMAIKLITTCRVSKHLRGWGTFVIYAI